MTIQVPKVIPGDWNRLRVIVDKLKHLRLGGDSSPTFTGLTLSGLTASRLVATDSSKALESSNLASWVTQTANQVLVADDGDGTITLSTPQNIHAGASPTFANVSLGTGELTAGSINRASGTLTLEIGGTTEQSITSTETTFGGSLVIPDGGMIGSVSDTDAIQIEADGDVVLSQRLGIGTTPGAKLDVLGISAILGIDWPARVERTDETNKVGIFLLPHYKNSEQSVAIYYGFSDEWQSAVKFGGGSSLYNAATYLSFFTAANPTTVKGTERIRVSSSGYIGFNELAPETLLELTHATPYLTLHNDTHEDSDGGRESRIIFKGEQSGQQETTLARIEVGHDGNADDQKGYLDIFINTGSDGNSPTKRMRIDAAGNTYIGDGGATNFLKIEPDGTIQFNGTATVFNDIVISLSSAKVPPANAPSWGSFVGNLNAYAYALNDFQEFSTELVHSYKGGSTIEFHIHGAVNGTDGTDRIIKFEIEYSIADVQPESGFGDVYPNTTTIFAELTIPAATTDLTAFTIDIGDNTTGNFIQGAIVKGRIRRIASSGSEPSADPFLTEVGIHIESDTIGTRTATSK